MPSLPTAIIRILAVTVVLGALLVRYPNPVPTVGQDHEIRITAQGFAPKELIVQTGATVTFVVDRSEPSWPASDPHPTHEYLAGFDPGKTLDPGERWSFTLKEPGLWNFHDHKSPSLHGRIVVLDETGKAKSSDTDYCDDGQCFDEIIHATVLTQGIDAAYALFTKTYAEGKLPRSCHWTAHKIGEAAYELFQEGKDFPISYATSYCGYGFYHGFLEGLLRENPDADYALSFCDKVKAQLGTMGLWNCYHGIGHGFTEDPPDPRMTGDANAMLTPGIKMCEFLFGTSFSNLNLCLTGVYTVIAGFASENKYDLSMNEGDPFAFCRTQPYRYHKACYGEFAPKLDKYLQGNIARLPTYLRKVTDEKTQRLVTWVVPSVSVARDILNGDLTRYARECKTAFTGRLKDICLGGTILGIFSHGEPEKQHLRAFDFCAKSDFTREERSSCYEEVFHRLRQDYSGDKVAATCNLAPKEYRVYCDKRIHPPAYDDPVFDS